jgi:hypothetical protein
MPDESNVQDKSSVPSVADGELLARFVLYGRWVRADRTVKPDAFIPHPHPDLSVSRHTGISEDELWQLGQAVANARPATLYGRADVEAQNIKSVSLKIEPSEPPKNHANITGWPLEKSQQKNIAQQIVVFAHYSAMPSPR